MTIAVVLLLLYIVPGFAAAAIFTDRTRLNPGVWLLLSLLVLPIGLANLGTLGLRSTTSVSVAALVVFVAIAAWALARAARGRGYGVRLPVAEADPAERLPRLLAALLLAIFWVGTSAARVSLLSGHEPSISDDLQRIAQVTSIAVTGVPPRHYYMPEMALSYYYYDFVLPGLAVRLADPLLSAAGAIFYHVALHTLAIVIAIHWIAFRLCRRWSGLYLVALLTFAGGWDYWALWANSALTTSQVEHWAMLDFNWHPVPQPFYQMSLPTTLAIWVPHHWIVGFFVLLVPAIICHLEGERVTRAVLLGIVLAFVAGCSVFAGIGLGAGLALWLVALWRERWREWDLRACAISFGVAAVLSVNLLPIYLGKKSMIAPYWPGELPAGAGWLEFLLTKGAALPDFITILTIENGVAFLLFFVWLLSEGRRILRDPTRTWIAAVGVGLLPWTYLLRSPIFDDFAMRGMVPAQVAWPVGATWALTAVMRPWARRAVVAVALAGALLALPSTGKSLYVESKNGIEAKPLAPSISWINSNAPLDSPVLMMQSLSQLREWKQYMIERMKLVQLRSLKKLLDVDYQYFQQGVVEGLEEPFWSVDSVEDACRTGQRLSPGTRFVYVLDRPQAARGRRIFKQRAIVDEYAGVFEVDCSGFRASGAYAR